MQFADASDRLRADRRGYRLTPATPATPALERIASPRLLAVAVAAIYLAACLYVLPQIPASWDELGNRNHGEIGLELAERYLETGEPAEQRFLHEHGTAFEMLLIGVEKVVGGDFETDPSGALRIRHGAIFAFFACAVFAFYLFLRDLFSSRLAGWFGAVLLALHPRIFHHGFHNSSDIGFLSLSVFWIWTLQHLCRRPTVARACVHALFCALAIDTRVVGVFFLGVSGLTLAANALHESRSKRDTEGSIEGSDRSGTGRGRPKRLLVALAWVAASTSVFTVLFWPFLWGRPIGNLLWAVSQFARFDVPSPRRYMGRLIWSTDVPWHYNPVWILITTPWYVTGGVIVGVLAFLRHSIARRTSLFDHHAMAVPIGLWIAVPLIAPMVLGSTLFNGWRHHYFVYPAIVAVSTWGVLVFVRWFGRLVPRVSGRGVLLGLIVVVIVHLTTVVGSLHPYQNLYFSSPFKHWFGKQQGTVHVFETDYWCTSYREGLAHLASVTDGPINVYGHWKPLWLNRLLLSPEERRRIRIVRNIGEADFYLGVFAHNSAEGEPRTFGWEIFGVDVDGVQILSVQALRPPPYGRPAASTLPESPSEIRGLIARHWHISRPSE